MKTNQYFSFLSDGFNIIKKTVKVAHACLCTLAQGAMTWFSLEHFFHPLHIKNHYVRDSFQVIRAILSGATTITTALTRGTEVIYPNEHIVVSDTTPSLKKKIFSNLSYWSIGWSASWFIFLTFFTIVYSILPEEDEPTFALEEISSLLVAFSVRHGFMVEIAARLRHSMIFFNKSKVVESLKSHPVKLPLSLLIAGIFSLAQSYRIYSITTESVSLLSSFLSSINFSPLGFVGRFFANNINILCYISASTIGFSTYMAYTPEVYKHMISDKPNTNSISEKFALSVIYLDAIIVAIENALIIADFGLSQSDEEYNEFLSYLAILVGFISSFYAARCFNSSAEKNVIRLFKRNLPQTINNDLEECSPLLIN